MKILLLLLLTILQTTNARVSKKVIAKEFGPFLKMDTLSKAQKFPQIEKLLLRVNTPQKQINKARKAFLSNTRRARKTFLTLVSSYLGPMSTKKFFGFLALDLVGYTFINHKIQSNKIRKLKGELRSLHKQIMNSEMKEYEVTKQLNSAIADLQSRLEEFESQTDANVSNLNSYAAMQNSSLI